MSTTMNSRITALLQQLMPPSSSTGGESSSHRHHVENQLKTADVSHHQLQCTTACTSSSTCHFCNHHELDTLSSSPAALTFNHTSSSSSSLSSSPTSSSSPTLTINHTATSSNDDSTSLDTAHSISARHLSSVNTQYPKFPNTKPLIVTVTGAAGNIAYSLLWQIGTGQMLGPRQPVELRLLEIPKMASHLRAIISELLDSNLPLISSIIGTTDYKTAFHDSDVALLLGGKPKFPGIKRRQLLQANAHIFTAQGQALNAYASRNVKVVVLATPALTNALICQSNAPDLPATNFTALTRLDHNRAKHQIAQRVGCTAAQIKNLIIFGNGSKTQLPDVSQAVIVDWPHEGVNTSVREAVADNDWLSGDFIEACVGRGAAIARVKQKTAAGSAASATCAHVRDWIQGTAAGEYVSMAVKSDGSYGVPKDLFFSLPVTCQDGEYKIVHDLEIDEFGRGRLNATIAELQLEREQADVDAYNA